MSGTLNKPRCCHFFEPRSFWIVSLCTSKDRKHNSENCTSSFSQMPVSTPKEIREISCSRRKEIKDQQILQRGSMAVTVQSETVNTVQSSSKTAKLEPTIRSSRTSGKEKDVSCSIAPDSSINASSSNESDEDDFDYGAFIDRANQRKLLYAVIKQWVLYQRTILKKNG